MYRGEKGTSHGKNFRIRVQFKCFEFHVTLPLQEVPPSINYTTLELLIEHLDCLRQNRIDYHPLNPTKFSGCI
jgi:hypothetical protein